MIWTPPTEYSPISTFKAKIGGILYRNVPQPIVYNDQSLITLSRNAASNQLAASFDITRHDGLQIASVMYNEISLYNTVDYIVLEGRNRATILEKQTGRAWCDIKTMPENPEYELEISCLLLPNPNYPIFLHPDRSKFGKANDNEPPNIGGGGTLTTVSGSSAGAIELRNAQLYLLGVTIENFAAGVRITHTQHHGSG